MKDDQQKPKRVRKHSFHDIEYNIRWRKPDKRYFGFDARGSCSDPRESEQKPEIEISPNLEGKELLEVAIHEATHACLWPISEEYVEKNSKDIADFLWKLGFRIKKD